MLATLKEVLKIAEEGKYALGSFNTPNSESLFAVLNAAEQLKVPVIISHAQCHEAYAPLHEVGPMMVAMARLAKVPVCVHLDHGEDAEYCKKAIELGFTSVMYDNSYCDYEENVKRTAELVAYAHARGVDVEAELGALPERESGEIYTDLATATEKAEEAGPKANDTSAYTKPELVPDFVGRTGCDALAISFGNAHGFYKVKPVLNIDIIRQVREKSDVCLVMHGGSGITPEDFRRIIAAGVSKVNYYSYMGYAGYAAAKEQTDKVPANFYHILTKAAQDAMQANVLAAMKVFAGIDD